MITYKISAIPGFNFPYPLEYCVNTAILVELGILFVLVPVLLILESTVPHIKIDEEPYVLEK